MDNSEDYQPIIIIGAARSGTNMLRDILTSIDDFATWPCDEINYIWRYGNANKKTDEFSVADVNSQNKKYIKNQFDKLYKDTEADFIVEKTCANSLRVDFINQILPEAKYIFLFRNPIDVVASAKKRWKAPLDIKYILKKARYVPLKDIPYYAVNYLWNRIYKFFTQEKRLAFWGPKFEGMEELLEDNSLEEVSAMQWKRSVEKSFTSLKDFNGADVYGVSYEDFVHNPAGKMDDILNFLEIDLKKKELKTLVSNVSTSSVNKGYQALDKNSIEKVEEITNSIYERIREEYEMQ